MKNLIYQTWDGNVLVGVKAGVEAMKAYAKRIGADYVFDDNPKFVTNLGMYSPHYGKFKPIYTDKLSQYDNVLVVDTDVFPRDGLTENVFDGFVGDVGMCTEPFQPQQRKKFDSEICTANDEKWASIVEGKWKVKMPRTEEGLLKVYNSGFVLYSNAGMAKAKKLFTPFKQYVDMINQHRMPAFYTCDQPYVHAMVHVCGMNFVELNNGWNCYLHHYWKDATKKEKLLNDSRTPDFKMVHIQLRTADHWDAQKLWTITNRPVEEWNL